MWLPNVFDIVTALRKTRKRHSLYLCRLKPWKTSWADRNVSHQKKNQNNKHGIKVKGVEFKDDTRFDDQSSLKKKKKKSRIIFLTIQFPKQTQAGLFYSQPVRRLSGCLRAELPSPGGCSWHERAFLNARSLEEHLNGSTGWNNSRGYI